MRKKLIVFFLLFVFLFSSGFGCSKISSKVRKYTTPITLNYWRVWDGPDDFAPLIAKYQRMHPFVRINYRKLRYSEYEKMLMDGFATNRGPDIFSIHNTWMRKYQSKNLIGPVPSKITLAYMTVKGSLKKELVPVLKTTNSINTNTLKKIFVDTVYPDVVIRGKDSRGKYRNMIYGLPMALDTLALYYNKDLFNNAGIIYPPKYWNREFQQNVKKLTKQNTRGEIIQSGIALGGVNNINRSTDILALFMMQNGTEMMRGGKVSFQLPSSRFNKQSPGLDALRFYTDFANPAKEVYSWNENLDNALDMFVRNKLAMMIGYKYLLPEIKARAPRLHFDVVPIPQIEKSSYKVNYANYWVEVVSKDILSNPANLKRGSFYTHLKYNTAWDFVQFITKEKQVYPFLKRTKKLTVLRSLVDKQINDEEMKVFAEQILTAKSWYHGKNSNAMEAIMKEMILKAVRGQGDLNDIINMAASKVQQTIN